MVVLLESISVAIATVVVFGLTKIILKHLSRLKSCDIWKCSCEYNSDVEEEEQNPHRRGREESVEVRCPIVD